MLNIPTSFDLKIKDSKNILLLSVRDSAMLSSLPIYLYLRKLNKEVHIANYSATDFATVRNYADPVIMDANILGATSIIKEKNQSYQEGYLSLWFKQFFKLPEEKVIWFVNKVGPKALTESYKKLIAHLEIDTIIFVDFGVDSLLFGTEQDCPRTIIDSCINYSAFKNIEIENKISVIIGATTETNGEDVYFSAMRNLTRMSQQGGVLGSCNLMNYMKSFQVLKNACQFISFQSGAEISETNKIILSSVEGIDFDDENNQVPYVSLLMSQYWFLDANAIAYNNAILQEISEFSSYYDIVQFIMPRLRKSN